MTTTVIYALEKRPHTGEHFEHIDFYHQSNLDLAETDYEMLESNGYGEYRLRKIEVSEDNTWSWSLHKHNYETSDKED